MDVVDTREMLCRRVTKTCFNPLTSEPGNTPIQILLLGRKGDLYPGWFRRFGFLCAPAPDVKDFSPGSPAEFVRVPQQDALWEFVNLEQFGKVWTGIDVDILNVVPRSLSDQPRDGTAGKVLLQTFFLRSAVQAPLCREEENPGLQRGEFFNRRNVEHTFPGP